MTATRVAAGVAALVTAVLLQAAVIGPVAAPWPVSLPAVLVAAVGAAAGPATGMAFGFGLGLVSDLAGEHLVGAQALTWLGLGIAAGALGALAPGRRVALAGLLAGAGTVVAIGLIAAVDAARRADALHAAWTLLPATASDIALAALVVPLTARVLRSAALQPAVP